MDQYDNEPVPTVSEEEYDEILDKLKIADFMHTENSLQEIIYQLAKVMICFTHIIHILRLHVFIVFKF